MAVAGWLGVFVLVALAASQVVLEEDYDNQRNCLLTKYGPMKVSKLCVSLGSKKMVAWGQKKNFGVCLSLSSLTALAPLAALLLQVQRLVVLPSFAGR